MTEDQLIQAKKLKKEISTNEETLERVGTVCFSWKDHGTSYRFTKSQLGEIPELIAIFESVEETTKTLLQKQIEKQIKKLTTEFEKL